MVNNMVLFSAEQAKQGEDVLLAEDKNKVPRSNHYLENVFDPIGNGISYTSVSGNSVDELVRNAILNILRHGTTIHVRAGKALQAYGVNYILYNPRNRLLSIRKGGVRYLCRELIAYFSGSLDVRKGLSDASKFWITIANEDGKINSNYGYYVFHEKVDIFKNQYNWAIERLAQNNDTRRAIININQTYHKSDTKDFPCTVAIQFFIKQNTLHCEVMSRSTDVITGLPYDMGFFSFIHELIFQDLIERGHTGLKLGSTVMKTSFTQIYDKAQSKVEEVLDNSLIVPELKMPTIVNSKKVLEDIYHKTSHSDVVKWIISNAEICL